MPTSNRIILTDVDGVLLEWEHHFTKWLQLRSYFDKNGTRNYPYKLVDIGKTTTRWLTDLVLVKIQYDKRSESSTGVHGWAHKDLC